jgi:hypothetical protein
MQAHEMKQEFTFRDSESALVLPEIHTRTFYQNLQDYEWE